MIFAILPEFKDRINGDEFYSTSPKEDAVVKFWTDLPKCFVPIASENQVCREDLGYSGTFDLLFYYDAELDGKSDDKEVCSAIDKTSKWLVDKGWYGLPTPYDKEGVQHFKTAWGVVTDMRQFNEIMQRYVEEAHANDPRNKNKK